MGIREVADAAGVSITTVSHALNGKGRINERTRRRVQQVAEQLGYRPNTVARSLAGGRSGLIGLAIAQTSDGEFAISDIAFYSHLMNAATIAAFDRGYALVLASGAQEAAWNNLWLDGLIVVDPIRDDPLCAEFRGRGIPVVTTGRIPEEDGGHWVDCNHFEATPAILDHLAARGARRIALIGTAPITSYSLDTRAAYQQWCKQHDQEPMIAVARAEESAGFETTQKLLRRAGRPDAIYAMLDRLAIGALLAAQAEGLSVPGQLQVAGCTDSDAGKREHLTAIVVPPEQIGRAAVAMVADLIEGREPPEQHVWVPTRIVPRRSTRRKALVRERLPA